MAEAPPSAETTLANVTPAEPDTFTTEPNAFGIFRRYPHLPSKEPPNPNPYAGFAPTSWTDWAPIASNLSVSTPEQPPEQSKEGPGFAKASWSAWLNSGSPYKSCGKSNKITRHFTNPTWN